MRTFPVARLVYCSLLFSLFLVEGVKELFISEALFCSFYPFYMSYAFEM